ncbi:hypothetical protein [Phytomonospora endophytica]|uniref:hypothetical protein n=1 Tax=Phytomonospora endophytica TaxID=714109 RepID=UPI00161982D1|nr:hypothetical protein [Phytomonospora endophytica]
MSDLTCPQCLSSDLKETGTALVLDMVCVVAPVLHSWLGRCGCAVHTHQTCAGCGLKFSTGHPAEEVSASAAA